MSLNLSEIYSEISLTKSCKCNRAYRYCIYLQFVRSLSSIYKKKNLIRWWFLWIFNRELVKYKRWWLWHCMLLTCWLQSWAFFVPQTPNQHFFFCDPDVLVSLVVAEVLWVVYIGTLSFNHWLSGLFSYVSWVLVVFVNLLVCFILLMLMFWVFYLYVLIF